MTIRVHLNNGDEYHKIISTTRTELGEWELSRNIGSSESTVYFGKHTGAAGEYTGGPGKGREPADEATEMFNLIVSDLVLRRIHEYMQETAANYNIGVGRLELEERIHHGDGKRARDALEEGRLENALALVLGKVHIDGRKGIVNNSGELSIRIESMFYMPHRLYGKSIDARIVDQLAVESNPDEVGESLLSGPAHEELHHWWIELAVLSYVRQQIGEGASGANFDELRRLLGTVSVSERMVRDSEAEIDRLDDCESAGQA